MQTKTIYTLGEATFDILFKEDKPFDAKVGGSVLNTSVSLGRLGASVQFVAAFGNDKPGDMAMTFLSENNISTKSIQRYNGSSRLALAFLDDDNNAQYCFYPGNNSVEPIFPEVKSGDIILYGSSYALRKDIRIPLVNFLKIASAKGAIIVYDPNFRKSQIPQLEILKPYIEENISLSDIVKGSDEDFLSIFNSNPEDTFKYINGISSAVLICTANKNGVKIFTDNFYKHVAVPAIQPVSTIGAGDTFNAGIVYTLYKHTIEKNQINQLTESFWIELMNTGILFSQQVCMSYENYLTSDFISKNLR